MSRVHDALRRAEMGDLRSVEAPVATAPEPPVRTPEFLPINGPPSPIAVTPVRLNIHPGMLGDAPMVPFQPAPESHLLDLNNSHETPA